MQTFMGYNPFGYEVTAGRKDLREQFDFSVDNEPLDVRGEQAPLSRLDLSQRALVDPPSLGMDGTKSNTLPRSIARSMIPEPPFFCHVFLDGDPQYRRVVGPAQWPHEADLPGFRDCTTRVRACSMETSFSTRILILGGGRGSVAISSWPVWRSGVRFDACSA
jgi:isopenicillin N synthase-like dioxygenase